MKKLMVVLALSTTVRIVAAATPTCPAENAIIKQGKIAEATGWVTAVIVNSQSNAPVAGLRVFTAASGALSLTEADLTNIRTAEGIVGAGHLALMWQNAEGNCTQAIEIPGQTHNGAPATDETGAYLGASDQKYREACLSEGETWITTIRNERKISRAEKDDFTVVVFSKGGDVCSMNRSYGVAGDPIYVGLVDDSSLEVGTVQFQPCEIERAGPLIYVSADFDKSGVQAAKAMKPKIVPLYRGKTCFNESLEIVVKGQTKPTTTGSGNQTAAAPFEWHLVLSQTVRWRGTLQLGALFTDLHDHDFSLRRDGAGLMRIQDRGPVDTGPEYFTSLVIYGFPYYLRDLFTFGRTRYMGRDIIHDQSILDRTGLLLGVGLNEPARRFETGASFELVAGVNGIVSYDFALVKRLDGFKNGDLFTGSKSEIPTTDRWERDWSVGLSIDLRYVTALFKRG